jgi:hypothetical protein
MSSGLDQVLGISIGLVEGLHVIVYGIGGYSLFLVPSKSPKVGDWQYGS